MLIAVAAAALFSLVGWFWAMSQAKKAAARAAALEEDLKLLKAQPREWELRVDRFDLLWFPLLSSTTDKKVVGLAVGVPHCRACVQPLSLGDKGWRCAGCGGTHPESLADLMVTDSVAAEALKQFLLKHNDHRAALK